MSSVPDSPRTIGTFTPDAVVPAGEENLSVVFTGPGQVEVRSEPCLEPGAGDVLIRTLISLISTGTELTLLGGAATGERWRDLTRYPRLTGYSNVGEVLAVGAGVDPGWVGRTVHNHGNHQALTLSPADRLAALPEGVAREDATFATLAKVAMNGLRRAAVTWGETVAVVGLGIVGQLACRLCAAIGVRRVFAIETSDFRLGMLPETARIVPCRGDVRDGGVRERILALNGGRGVDVVVEATGNPDVLPAEPRLLRPQGRFLLLSSPRGPSVFDFHDLCNRESLTIVGSHGFSHPPPGSLDNVWTSRRHGELFLAMLQEGDVGTAALISHRFEARQAPLAYRLLEEARDSALGVILEWP